VSGNLLRTVKLELQKKKKELSQYLGS